MLESFGDSWVDLNPVARDATAEEEAAGAEEDGGSADCGC